MLYHNVPQYRLFYYFECLGGHYQEVSYQGGRYLDLDVALFYQQELEYVVGLPSRIVEVE